MANYRVVISLDPGRAVAGARAIKAELRNLDEQANKTRAAVARVGSADKGWASNAIGEARINGMIAGTREGAMSWKHWQSAADSALTSTSGGLKKLIGHLGISKEAVIQFAAVVGTAFVASKIYEYADAYANLQNKLRTVISAESELGPLTKKIFAMANENRVAVEDMASVYQRAAKTMQTYGYTARDTAEFVDTLTKVISVSGVSSIEASQGLIQLMQGMAAGKVAGQDLKAMIHDIPAVGDVIAKYLGTTRENLAKLGAQGKITTELVFKAFGADRQKAVEDFAKIAATPGQAMVVLHNKLIEFVGGLTTQLGPALLQIANLLGDLLAAVEPLISLFGDLGGTIGEVVGSGLVDFFREAAESVKTNFKALGEYKEALTGVIGLWADNKDVLKAMFTPAGVTGVLHVLNSTHDLTDVTDAHGKKATQDAVSAELAASASRWMMKKAHDRKKYEEDVDKEVEASVRKFNEKLIAMNERDRARAAAAWQKYIQQLKGILAELDPIGKAQSELIDTTAMLESAAKKHIITDELAAAMIERKTKLLHAALEPMDAMGEELQKQIYLLGLSNEGREKEAFLMKAKEGLFKSGYSATQAELDDLYELEKIRKRMDALNNRKVSVTAEIKGPKTDAAANLEALTSLFNDGTISLKEYTRATVEQRAALYGMSEGLAAADQVLADGIPKSQKYAEAIGGLNLRFPVGTRNTLEYILAVQRLKVAFDQVEPPKALDGFHQQLANMIAELGNSSQQFFDLFKSGVDAISQSIVDLVMNVDTNFQEMFTGLLHQLTEMIVKILMAKLLLAAVGGAGSPIGVAVGLATGGGIHAATGGTWQARGSGGIDSVPLMGRVSPGEIVRITTPSQEREQGGGGADVNVHMTNRPDEEFIFTLLRSPRARKIQIDNIGRQPGAIKGLL